MPVPHEQERRNAIRRRGERPDTARAADGDFGPQAVRHLGLSDLSMPGKYIRRLSSLRSLQRKGPVRGSGDAFFNFILIALGIGFFAGLAGIYWFASGGRF